MGRNLNEILSNIVGLEPKACLVLGPGFVREEWKTLCFKRGFSIIGPAIQNVGQIAFSLVPDAKDQVLEPQARIELLRAAFAQNELRLALPILSRNRSRPNYFERLDQTIQQGRMSFAHEEESEVIAAHLVEKTGNLQKREEYFLLNRYWQRLLEVRNLWDEARLFESAVQQLNSGALPPFSIYYRVEHQKDKPRVDWFWTELSKKVEVRKFNSKEILEFVYPHRLKNKNEEEFIRKQTHSLEDAAHFIMDTVAADLDHQAVVIQDDPVIRRTLTRVASQRGIPLLDPRDPTLVTRSEAIKLALLDFELCAKNFTRPVVLEWVSAFFPDSGKIRKKIIDSALVQGIDSYRKIPEVHRVFQSLQERYTSRINLDSLESAMVLSIQEKNLPAWTASVIQKTFQEWKNSLRQIDLDRARKPIRFWYEQLRTRLSQVNPVVDPTKNRSGLRLYRVDQCPSLLLDPEKTRTHFFGIENSFFEIKENQGEWFSVRDQEILANEFGWISSNEKSDQNRYSFDLWNFGPGTLFWEFDYDESGSETEGFEFTFGDESRYPIQKTGAHSRMFASWKGATPISMDLKPLQFEKDKNDQNLAWPFSLLNAYGNCPFVAYAQYLLKLQDERDVDVELAADRFGTLLHQALEQIVKKELSPEEAFHYAWENTPAIAWEKNDRWFEATRSQIVQILKVFAADERVYREQSQTRLFDSEKEIGFQFSGIPFKGRIDRIDQHEDGLVVIDYKTSQQIADGLKSLDRGKDLQLGLYAIAVRDLFQQEVISAQYVRLDENKVNRNAGFLFSKWNKGKKADQVESPVSTARSDSGSLFQESPEEIWKMLRKKVDALAEDLRAGKFSPNPADPAGCAQCRYRDVCGESRR
jgi:hypothetical protein